MEVIVVFISSIIGFVILLYIAKAVFGFSTLKKHAEYQTAILEAIAMKQGCDTLYLRNKAIEIFN
jgi:UPF0716 family protein affecting phage T7 exclusion